MNTIESIKISELFLNDEYRFIIPIYQRNYTWTEKEINTLLDDIIMNNDHNVYYLGTIVSYKQQNGIYEVIDGQQRLTTLFLIYLYIENYNKKNGNILGDEKLIKNNLHFEVRKKYIKTLKYIANNAEIKDDEVAKEIVNGYKLINDYFEYKSIKKLKKILKKIKTTEIVIITIPENTDLNNYFRVMNTRGEQLEQHHIAKARFICKVGNNNNDRKIVAEIWDACSNMNYHVQRNFDQSVKEKLFSKDLLKFVDDIERYPKDIDKAWDNLAKKFGPIDEYSENESISNNSIKNIITGKCISKNNDNNSSVGNANNNSYSSIISFPYFLLHVNATLLTDYNDTNNLYDDKKLLKNLEEHLKNEKSVKRFIYHMLQCRFLFDQYIVKKDSQDFSDSKELKLIKYKYYENSGGYTNTFDDTEISFDNLIKLQSILRITYVSQGNMQWITELLKDIAQREDEAITLKTITDLLEKYCINKIKDIDFKNLSYGNIERIVFTYLDYILYRDNNYIKENMKDWIVQFRTSIEHFFPQNPENNDGWSDDDLHCFGNLALITTSGNSKFSNYYPDGKVNNYKEIIQQSPKLKLMASYTEDGGKWTPEKAEEHQKEMFEILAKEINSKK